MSFKERQTFKKIKKRSSFLSIWRCPTKLFYSSLLTLNKLKIGYVSAHESECFVKNETASLLRQLN